MSKEIKALEELVESMERTYNEALQTKEEPQIAYQMGMIDGVRRAIFALKELEEA